MGTDIFAVGEDKFLAIATIFNVATASYADVLGIPTALVSDNTAKLAAYTAAYHVVKSPNAGKLDREDCKAKHAALTRNIRKIKKAYIDADPLDAVTPEILLRFGLPRKDKTRTDVPDPTEVVSFSLENGEYLQIIVKHPARPPRYNGAVAFYKVGGPVPTNFKELTSSKLLTRSREILVFDKTQLGQTLYISLRWENEKGRLGPPSPIQSHVIA